MFMPLFRTISDCACASTAVCSDKAGFYRTMKPQIPKTNSKQSARIWIAMEEHFLDWSSGPTL
eukprot:4478569-Pleurochrysis_carterae.AAC.6